MTGDDMAVEWAVTRLINLYANLNDEARWEAVADLFVEDGVLIRPSAPDRPLTGRAAILAAFRARPPRTTRHLCGNIVVTPLGPDAAEASSAMLMFSGPPAEGDALPARDPGGPLVGGFHDRLVRTAAGWRFTERRGVLTFRA